MTLATMAGLPGPLGEHMCMLLLQWLHQESATGDRHLNRSRIQCKVANAAALRALPVLGATVLMVVMA